MSLIIKESDPRYSKLPEVFNKYDYDSVCIGSGRSITYLLPNELSRDQSDHLIYRSTINKSLESYAGLSLQEYFDLVVLHINDTDDRPRCTHCNKYLEFSGRFRRGYNSSTPWLSNSNHFCNHSCQNYYHWKFNRDHRLKQIIPMVHARELTRYDPDSDCHLYLAWCSDGRVKYGITFDLKARSLHKEFKSIHSVMISSRSEINNIESRLKLIYLSEYLDYSGLHDFILVLKSILATRPVVSPFD